MLHSALDGGVLQILLLRIVEEMVGIAAPTNITLMKTVQRRPLFESEEPRHSMNPTRTSLIPTLAVSLLDTSRPKPAWGVSNFRVLSSGDYRRQRSFLVDLRPKCYREFLLREPGSTHLVPPATRSVDHMTEVQVKHNRGTKQRFSKVFCGKL
jgi:hypothetical protein